MPKTLYNADPFPQVIRADEPATQPGDSRVFTDEELENGIAGRWVEHDPRSGLAAEVAWKSERDKVKGKTVKAKTTDPPEATVADEDAETAESGSKITGSGEEGEVPLQAG